MVLVLDKTFSSFKLKFVFQKRIQFYQYVFWSHVHLTFSSSSGTTPDEEDRMWQLGMAKARQSHTNLGKIILQIQEEVQKKPKKPAHSEVIEQLKVEKPKMETLKLQYETIVTTGQIPNMDPPQPTTSSLLRKKMVEDTRDLTLITPPKRKLKI